MLIGFLELQFTIIERLPLSVQEALHLMCFKHIASTFMVGTLVTLATPLSSTDSRPQSLLTDRRIPHFNVMSLYHLDKDLHAIEAFAQRRQDALEIGYLEDTFAEIRQVCCVLCHVDVSAHHLHCCDDMMV